MDAILDIAYKDSAAAAATAIHRLYEALKAYEARPNAAPRYIKEREETLEALLAHLETADAYIKALHQSAISLKTSPPTPPVNPALHVAKGLDREDLRDFMHARARGLWPELF